jgi:hypothetical protein
MYLLLSLVQQEPQFSLVEPDDCTRLHVAIERSLSEEVVKQTFLRENIGWLDDHQNAWITLDALRQLAVGSVQPDWPERFSAMLAYAERKGWLNAEKTAVSGHCEWSA